ncbi:MULTISPECIES: DUF6444 domain-containing protein [unclassified Microcystis]|uniref:DUF6444 domain-containing protein n=1 Tax=unclassified Microcystis TaxID=2643300 RepID=UPI00338F2966
MVLQIEQQDQRLKEVLTVQEQLLEKINSSSKNSSLPPSSDPPGLGKKQTIQKSRKKRGGQPGHKGNSRDLYPIEECSEVIDHHPQACANCSRYPHRRRHKPLSSPDSRNSTNQSYSH